MNVCRKNKGWVIWLVGGLLFATTAFVAQPSFAKRKKNEAPLVEQAEALEKKYAAVVEQGYEMALEGHLDENVRALVSLVPNRSKSAGDYWYLGNLLYGIDPKTSYDLHKKAYDRVPDDSEAILEWAMQQHRAGDCKSAAPLYQQYLRGAPASVKFNALLAECLVRLGDYAGGVDAWKKADHGQNHTSIDFAIYAIFGDEDPLAKRNDILKRLRAGDGSLYEELIVLDVNWERDWWNSSVFEDGLRHDLEAARKALEAEPARVKAMEILAGISVEGLESDALAKRLRTDGLIFDEKATLPRSSLIAAELIGRALRGNLSAGAELEKRFAKELWRRVTVDGDTKALEILAYLASCADESEDELRKIDKLGWEKFGLENFAASYVAGLAPAEAGESIAKAKREFPNNPVILLLGMQRDEAMGGKLKPAQVARLIHAEHASGLELSSLMQGMRYSYVLKSLYVQLGDLLSAMSQ